MLKDIWSLCILNKDIFYICRLLVDAEPWQRKRNVIWKVLILLNKYSSQKHSSYYFTKVIIVSTLYTLKKSFDVHKL